MNVKIKRLASILCSVVQWIAVAFLALIAAGAVASTSEWRSANIDQTGFFVAVAAFAAVTLLLSPPIFFKLPGKGKIGSCALVLPALAALIWTMSVGDRAYEKTPVAQFRAKAAAAHAASQAERDRPAQERAQRDRSRRAAQAMLEQHERDVADIQRRVQRCINWRGQVPAVVRRVKEALHNPRSFEHVHTEMRTVAGSGLPGIVMEYRAQNGFGAIRTEAVSAFIVPDDCSVKAMKEYEPSDF